MSNTVCLSTLLIGLDKKKTKHKKKTFWRLIAYEVIAMVMCYTDQVKKNRICLLFSLLRMKLKLDLKRFKTGKKLKSRFLTCHYHEIYREEAVGLKSSHSTLKITIFVNMSNLGQFR